MLRLLRWLHKNHYCRPVIGALLMLNLTAWLAILVLMAATFGKFTP